MLTIPVIRMETHSTHALTLIAGKVVNLSAAMFFQTSLCYLREWLGPSMAQIFQLAVMPVRSLTAGTNWPLLVSVRGWHGVNTSGFQGYFNQEYLPFSSPSLPLSSNFKHMPIKHYKTTTLIKNGKKLKTLTGATRDSRELQEIPDWSGHPLILDQERESAWLANLKSSNSETDPQRVLRAHNF